jgi:hypothetical protein
MFKSLYCKFLFYSTIKDRKKSWFAYDLFKLMPLYAVGSVQASPSTTEDDIDVINYGYKPSGYTNGSDHAVLDSSDLISKLSLSHNLFNNELNEISNLIHFIHCYVFNPNYKHSTFSKFYSSFKQDLAVSSFEFDSYNFKNSNLSFSDDPAYNDFFAIINYSKSSIGKNEFEKISRFRPSIVSKIKLHFIKGHNPILEREILSYHTNFHFGASGTRIRFLDINGNYFYKIEHFYRIEDGYYDLSKPDIKIEDRFLGFKPIGNFSHVINETSLSLLNGFDIAEKGVIPNKHDKVVFDMELFQ